MAEGRDRTLRGLSLSGIVLGVAIFGVGAAMLSGWALLGIGIAAVSGVLLTWVSFGRRTVVRGIMGGVAGSLAAWVAMRTMMRWVALSSGLSPILTIEGTLAILATSIMMGVLPAMGYVHFGARYGHSFKSSTMYGLLLSAIGGVPVMLVVFGEITTIAQVPLIPVSFFLGVPILFAVSLEAIRRTFKDV